MIGAAPSGIDWSKADPVDFKVDGVEPRFRVNLEDGTILELRVIVVGAMRLGNDPITGFPNYNLNTQVVVRNVKFGEGVRKAPPPVPGFR